MRRSSFSHARQIALLLLGSALLGGCSTLSNTSSQLANIVKPYQAELVQGNLVSKEQVELLKPGMSRNQVRDILGTPLLTSVFHDNRWDYAFRLKRPGVEEQSRRLTVYFQGDAMERFEGDTMPSEAEFVSQLASGRKLGKVPALEADADSLKKFTEANPRSAIPPPPTAAATGAMSYPPLEALKR